ncbi:MAG: sensor histidine kinase [Lachnospiraceae bacterium]
MKEKKQNWLFRFKSIRTTILLSFCVLIMISLLVFFVISINYTKNSVVQNSTEYTQQLIHQVNGNIDSYINYMENTSQMITRNRDVQEYLFQENVPDTEKNEQYNRVVSQFQTIMNSRADICNVAVIGDNGRMIINRGNSKLNLYHSISSESWFQEAKKENEKGFVLSGSHVQNTIAGNYPWVITLSRGIYNNQTEEIQGVMFIDLNYSAINDLCKTISLGEKGYIYLLDENGTIIYHPQQQLIYSGMKEEVIQRVMEVKGNDTSFVKKSKDGSKVYSVSKSEKSGWTVVGVSYMSELLKGRTETVMLYLFITILLLLIGAAISAFISGRITSPIRILDDSMKEVEKGHFDSAAIEDLSPNEIGRLGKTFNMMTRKIEQLMKQNMEEQRQKRKAEMRALQAQINPHFLYNTLDSIIWMAESGKNNQKVVLMTSSLAKLFRQSIGNDDELVTIAKEVEYTKTYLTIQEIRYQDKLAFHIFMEPDILSQQIVKLTLQPLVENAIYHGIKYAEHKGMLSIRGFREGDKIVLEVADNGMGMDETELEHIFEKREAGKKTNGVGVYNIQNRLQLYYGKEYGLCYQSKKGEGTVVTIRIPMMGAKQHENNEE